MEPLLLLTKNYLAEEDLVKKLHELGYEVLVSTNLLHQILKGQIFFSNLLFEKILVSLTVSNEEVEGIVANLPNNSFIIYRFDSSQETDVVLIEQVEYIRDDSSLRELRESLSHRKFTRTSLNTELRSQNEFLLMDEDKLDSFLKSLSGKEKELFRVLYTSQGQPVQRTDLVTAIWHKPPNSSQLAQLSQLIQKLHNKLENVGLPSNIIVTKWKKGYQLSDLFYQNLSQGISQLLNNIS